MATCGNCKEQGQTVDHIKACYAERIKLAPKPELGSFAKRYVEASDFRPMATATQEVPDSKYALDRDGVMEFYEVRTGRPGSRWDGYRFVDKLIGSPGDWRTAHVKGADRSQILKQLSADPLAAALRYSREFTRCAVCNSPLSDPVSREQGMGPICIRRF